MKIGLIIYLNEDIENTFKKLKELGISTCQLACYDDSFYNDKYANIIKKTINNLDIEITAFWCGWSGPKEWNFIDGYHTLGIVPIMYREQRIEELKRGADFAKSLGIKDVVTHMGFLPENMKTDEYQEIVKAIRNLATYLKKNNQYLLFETGQETPITLKRTIELVDTKNLGINLDPANLLLYGKGNPCDAIDVFGEYIRGVHAKDGEYPTNGLYLGIEKRIGEGRVNFPLMIKKLKDIRYDGAITIEREISGDEQIKDILYAKKFLEEIINEED